MKLEIGGGIKQRGAGWVNLDRVDSADIQHDLDVAPWPIDDDTIDEVYSSHCLEHLKCPFLTFNEICRICKVGAPVELRVPHPRGDLAMTAGHVHVFSPIQAINMEQYFPREFWTKPKRLRLNKRGDDWHIELGTAADMINRARKELPFLVGIPDAIVGRWIPGCAHECRFFYTVVENEFVTSPSAGIRA